VVWDAVLTRLLSQEAERFRDWVVVSPTKERQNESYLETAVGTERCNAVAWQRRVGERLGRLTLSKHWRVGLAPSLKADRTPAHALIEVSDCRNVNAAGMMTEHVGWCSASRLSSFSFASRV
jgi:hypothetical protein